jgi:hypothetical protein
MLYGNFYAILRSNGLYPGHTFALAALVGGLVPEILHRGLKSDEVVPLTKEKKLALAEGIEVARRLECM